jgi:hypothetical protein
MVLQTVDTANGPRALVTTLPQGADTDLKSGDVLLVYAATGEVIDGAPAVKALLAREAAKGVATFGFAVQRDGGVAVGAIRLPALNEADLQQKDQDLENKT